MSFVSLGVVCLVACALLRWLGRRGVGGGGVIRVLGRCQLEPHRSLYLIETAGRCFLLGVGEGVPGLITELDRAAVADVAPTESPSPLAQTLAKLWRRRAP